MGFTVDENPTTILSINGLQSNLASTDLVVPGLHRLYGKQVVSDMELVVTFRNVKDSSKIALLCIPIVIGKGQGNSYFKNLGTVTRDQPVLSDLISPTSGVMSYPGASLYKRSKTANNPNDVCSPISYPVTYYVVLSPSYIEANDYQRLHKQLGKAYVGGPVPLTEITLARANALLTYINTLTLDGPKKPKVEEDPMKTKSLKCYRIDPDKDIKDEKVYIGGAPGAPTLQQELQNRTSGAPDDSIIKPGDIETFLSVIVGLVIGTLICCYIAYHLWRGTFTHYYEVMRLYTWPKVSLVGMTTTLGTALGAPAKKVSPK